MKKSFVSAALAAAFVATSFSALAGEGMSCCKKADKTAAAAGAKCEGKDAAKCDPKSCKDHEKHTAAQKDETAKPAAKPNKPA